MGFFADADADGAAALALEGEKSGGRVTPYFAIGRVSSSIGSTPASRDGGTPASSGGGRATPYSARMSRVSSRRRGSSSPLGPRSQPAAVSDATMATPKTSSPRLAQKGHARPRTTCLRHLEQGSSGTHEG